MGLDMGGDVRALCPSPKFAKSIVESDESCLKVESARHGAFALYLEQRRAKLGPIHTTVSEKVDKCDFDVLRNSEYRKRAKCQGNC